MKNIVFVLALVIASITAACGSAAQSAPATPSDGPSAIATRSPEPTKPLAPTSQPPIAAPTRVSWAIDKGAPDDPAHRVLFELYFDGGATGFRVIDAAGQVIVRLPIAGSGIFDQSTCMAKARPAQSNATWVAIDDATYQRIAANWASYRVEVDTIAVSAVTLPLTDSGCRQL